MARHNVRYTRSMSNDEELTAEQAAPILRVSVRQVHRYREAGQLEHRRAGRRVLFQRASVEALAKELAVDIPHTASQSEPTPDQSVAVLPPGELLNYLRERETRLEAALLEIGRLQTRLQQAEEELKQLKAPDVPARRSLLARLLGRK